MATLDNQSEPPRIRIAVADDEVELRDYWHVILPRLGYDLAGIVASGEDLVDLCQQVPPDVVITDVHLPGLSGLDAIETIRREQQVAVVFVTGGRCEDESVAHGEEFVILAKPFPTRALRPAVEMALRRSRQASHQNELSERSRRFWSVVAPRSVPDRGSSERGYSGLLQGWTEEVTAAPAKRGSEFH